MRRTVKVLSFIFVFVLLVTLGCVATAAATAEPDAYVTIKAGESFTYGGVTIENPTGVDLIARYYADEERYALGVYSITTNDAEKDFGVDTWIVEQDQTDTWVHQFENVNVNYNINTERTFVPFVETSAGEFDHVADITFTILIPVEGVYQTCELDPEAFIIDADWGTIKVNHADIVVDDTDAKWTGVYDGQAHGGAIEAVTVPEFPATVYYSKVSAADAKTTTNTVYPTFTDVGTYTVYYRVEADNYNDYFGSYEIVIEKCDIANAVITLRVDSFVYTGKEQVAEIGEIKVGNLILTSADVTAVVVAGTDVGEYAAVVRANDNSNYKGFASTTWEITKATENELTLTIEDWTYGETAKAPVATADFGLSTIVYTYAKKGTTDFSATVPTAAGEYTVKAVIADTANYVGAEATADFTIEKADIDEDVLAEIKQSGTYTYNGTEQTVISTIDALVAAGKLPAYIAADSIGVSAEQTDAVKDREIAYTLKFENYNEISGTWKLNVAKASVSIKTDSAEKVYDGKELVKKTYAITAGQLFGEDKLFTTEPVFDASITYITVANLDKTTRYGVVKNTVAEGYVVNPNYELKDIELGTLTIKPATLVLELNAKGSEYVFDGMPHTLAPEVIGEITGSVEGDTVGLDTTLLYRVNAGTTSTEAKDLRAYAMNADGVDTSLCYILTGVDHPVYVTIKPIKISLTIPDFSVVYGGMPDMEALLAATEAILPELIGNNEWVLDEDTFRVDYFKDNVAYAVTVPAGTEGYTSKVIAGISIPAPKVDAKAGDLASNYVITFESGKLTVNKRDITVTAGDLEVPFSTVTPAYTASVTVGKLVNGDTLTYEYDCDYTATTASGTVLPIAVTASGAAAVNYNITCADGELTVTDAEFTVVIVATADLIYNGKAQGIKDITDITATGLAAGVEATYTFSLEKDGTYGELTAITATDAGTYTVYFKAVAESYKDVAGSFTFTVLPYVINEVTWTVGEYIYNGYEQGPTATATGVLGETLEFTSTGATFVGIHEAFAEELLSDNPNYVLDRFALDSVYFTIKEAKNVAITAANVSIGEEFAISFKVPAIVFAQYNINSAHAVLTMSKAGEPAKNVGVSAIEDINDVKYYVFTYADIAPEDMGEVIVATLALGNTTDVREYSIENYCYNQLKKNGQDERFVEVLVAMLRYGAAAQKLENPAIADADLVTYRLTTEKAFEDFNAIKTAQDDKAYEGITATGAEKTLAMALVDFKAYLDLYLAGE